jgi:hypothetical protein
MRRLATCCLLGTLAFLPSGCVVLDATSVGFAMVTGQRLVTVSGEAKWAKPQQTVKVVSLATGNVVAEGTLDDQKRFSVRVSLPMGEDLAIALHAPGNAALLLASRGEKRQEDRELNLTRGSTAVAWGLGSVLGGLRLPGANAWDGKPEQWKAIGERLPISHGALIQGSASDLDALGVGSPGGTAAELAIALKESLETVRIAAGGHPRDVVLWPPLLQGWSNALGALPPSTGDAMAPQAAAAVDLLSVLDQIWAQHPYGEEQGALSVQVPLKEPGTARVPEALPAVIHGLRYSVSASMLNPPRTGTIPRKGIRFQGGALVLRVPDMPTGFASVDLELLDESSASLGQVNAQGVVSLAMTHALKAPTVEVSLEGTPTTRPGATF